MPPPLIPDNRGPGLYYDYDPREWRLMRDALSEPAEGTRWTFHKFLHATYNGQIGVWRRVNEHDTTITEDVSVN